MVKLFSGARDVDALELGGVCEHRDWCLPPTGEYKRQRCKWEEKKNSQRSLHLEWQGATPMGSLSTGSQPGSSHLDGMRQAMQYSAG